MPDRPLANRCLLVVENEYFLASDVARDLTNAGATIVGPVPTPGEARALIEKTTLDAAVLDVNLGGETVYSVAEVLAAFGVPLVFVTGYHRALLPKRYAGCGTCEKPIDPQALISAIGSALDGPIQR